MTRDDARLFYREAAFAFVADALHARRLGQRRRAARALALYVAHMALSGAGTVVLPFRL